MPIACLAGTKYPNHLMSRMGDQKLCHLGLRCFKCHFSYSPCLGDILCSRQSQPPVALQSNSLTWMKARKMYHSFLKKGIQIRTNDQFPQLDQRPDSNPSHLNDISCTVPINGHDTYQYKALMILWQSSLTCLMDERRDLLLLQCFATHTPLG